MAKQISINPAHRSDPSQRYMMPVFELRYQGKNQNTKTCLENLDAVSAKLRRPPSTIHKFFGLRFNTRLDEKAGKFFLRGTYKAKDLQPALDNYIIEYVLCGACGNPETTLLLDAKRNAIIRDCGACGNRSDVKGDERMMNAFVKEEAVKVVGGEKKKKKKKPSSASGAAEDKEDDGVEWTADVSKEAREKRRAELLGKTAAQELEDLFKKNELSPEPYLALKDKEGWSLRKFGEEIASLGFDGKVYTQLDTRKPLIEKLCAGKPELQLGFVDGIANLATLKFPHLAKSLSAILQKVFTLELVDEETFVNWSKSDTPAHAEARTAAAAFITWLTTAAEDEEE
eukprot:TRINITY_DN4859_c0_g1_i1.p1 TRINITY_DN4859_c0_g1~~TRINITY_DN4859_c0_g1_i1.p1  ORF type:complete len:342 (-),score=62.63 TRINITY_DN4859_c0_g1_i1:61-1086(-)